MALEPVELAQVAASAAVEAADTEAADTAALVPDCSSAELELGYMQQDYQMLAVLRLSGVHLSAQDSETCGRFAD